MAAPPSNEQRRGGGADILNPHVDWYLWRPCVGIDGACPPLARWPEMIDGTLTLEDVKDMHAVMDEIIYQRRKEQESDG